LKAFHEEGVEVITTPFRGRAIRTLWWKAYRNPCYYTGEAFSALLRVSKRFKFLKSDSPEKRERFVPKISSMIVKPRWERHIRRILSQESDIGAVLCLQLPLNQFKGMASKVRNEFGIPIVYYDCDLPVSLPTYGGYTFNAYVGADLGEYDAFIVNSGGAAPQLSEMGAPKVKVVHWGVDPSVYFPNEGKKDIDVFYGGIGTKFREKWIDRMIRIPSQTLRSSFVVSGIDQSALGAAVKPLPFLSFSEWIQYCWRSKIALNIARDSHALTPETSSSRPFELAALGCCIVSNPYMGLGNWFETGKEIFVAKNSAEALETYVWLLRDDEARERASKAARQRVLNEHTSRHRARSILSHISSLS